MEQPHVHAATDPSFDEVRRAAAGVVDSITEHLEGLRALPPGGTSFVRLADLSEPVRRAVGRWDRAVLAHTESLPLAIDDGWPDELDGLDD